MTEKDIRARIHGALDCKLDDVRANPFLAQRVIETAKGERKMKKKLSLAPLVALLILVFCLIAYAAGNRLGISSYLSEVLNRSVPESAQELITESSVNLETDKAGLSVTETYYDGRMLIFTADVNAKAAKTLLVGQDLLPDDPFGNLTGNRDDSISISRYYAENGYEHALYASVTPADWDSFSDITTDYRLAPDGTMSFLTVLSWDEAKEERSVEFELITEEGGSNLYADFNTVTRDAFMLTVSAADIGYPVYESTEPAVIEGAGIRIERLSITETPWALLYTIDCSVSDSQTFEPHMYGLFLDFIDPDSPAAEVWQMRLKEVAYVNTCCHYNEDGSFIQTGSIALEEMRDIWTLRAYDPFMDGKPTLGTVQISIQ